tara:strand:- start:6143 stop:6529 length:387 start_codon:yes stop_codon:yes gene_type:complete
MVLKKNKKIFITLTLYLVLFVTIKYTENKSLWHYKIFKNSLIKYEVTKTFPINNIYFETPSLLNNFSLNQFNISDEVYNDGYIRFKIITQNYPKKFNKDSPYFLSFINEKEHNCTQLEKKIFFKLLKC